MPIPAEPVVFIKAAHNVVWPYDPLLSARQSKKTDWEVELGGCGSGKAVAIWWTREKPMNVIAGYCISHDVSEREFQLERGGQWTKGKSCDNFNPVGPWLSTCDEIPSPQSLGMLLRVNGEIRQAGKHRYDDLWSR